MMRVCCWVARMCYVVARVEICYHQFMADNKYVSVNFRCTEEQKKQIQEMADKRVESLTQFCLKTLMEKVNNQDAASADDAPEDLTVFLKEQIKEKDDQIRDLRKLLDQEQQLHAMSRSDNQEQKLLINKLNRPFWQKWFGRE